MTSRKDIKKRVDRGVRWLNTYRKGWLKKINVRTLDLSNAYQCVCGQLFGDFWDAVTFEQGTGEKAKMSKRISIQRGFYSDSNEVLDILTQCWVEKIKKLKSN